MTNVIAKKHVTPDKRMLLALCDENLLGNIFEEDGKQLDLKSDFYKGGIATDDEAIALIGKSFMVNAVGEKSVQLCVKAKSLEDAAPKIKGIPYLQVMGF